MTRRIAGHETLRVATLLRRSDRTPEEVAVWNHAWDRSQARGDQHPWSAWVADEAVNRYRAKQAKTRPHRSGGNR